jgi:hypothetical protein
MVEKDNKQPAEFERARKERKARERLARPPKDRREVTIGPTNKAGPDITLG